MQVVSAKAHEAEKRRVQAVEERVSDVHDVGISEVYCQPRHERESGSFLNVVNKADFTVEDLN